MLIKANGAKLFYRGLLNLSLSSLKCRQCLLKLRHLLVDLTQLRLGLGARQMSGAKLCGDVALELAPQDTQIGVTPYRPLAVFKLPGPDAFHDEIPAHPVLLLSRYVTEGRPFAVPFTVFCHISCLRPNGPKLSHSRREGRCRVNGAPEWPPRPGRSSIAAVRSIALVRSIHTRPASIIFSVSVIPLNFGHGEADVNHASVLPSDTFVSRIFAIGCNRRCFRHDGLELWSVTGPFQPPRVWGAHC